MKNIFNLKQIFTAAALILISAATVSCGTYKTNNNLKDNSNSTQAGPHNIIPFKDGEYSLVRESSNDSYKAVNYFSELNAFHADGKTDDSQNLQQLLNKASKNGGGAVYLPKGEYLLENTVIIPENVSLTGDFSSPRSSAGTKNCTVFLVAENSNTLKSPLFVLNNGSSVSDITIYYKDQRYGDVKKYPYTIEHDSGKTAKIENITIINTANGINLSSTEATVVTVSNVYMTATQNGIYAMFCSDKLNLTNIFIDPSIWFNCDLDIISQTENAKTLTNNIKENLTAITVSAASDIYADNIKINTCRVGIKVDIPNITDNTPLFSNITVNDSADSGLTLLNAPKTGIAFAKCSFRTDDRYGSSDLRIEKNYESPTVFNSCSFRGSPSYSVYSEGNSMISFVGCEFISWKESAIYSTDKVISASGGGFNYNGDIADIPQSSIGLFALNRTYSGFSPEELTVFIADTNNEYTVNPITDTWFENLTTEFNIEDKVYNAKDFGVSEAAGDNSMALQMAINNTAQKGGGTVFLDKGTFNFATEIELKEGVRLQGAGQGKTLIKFKSDSRKVFLNLKGKNKVEGMTIEYIGSETPEIATESPVKAISAQSGDIKISNIDFIRTHYAIWLSETNNITIEHITGSSVIGGIYAEKCNFMHLDDISFTTKYLSDEVKIFQHEKFVAIMIRECSGTLCENLSSDNGDYLIYLNSEKVDVIPEEPSAAIKGLFAKNVYSAFAVNRYDFAAVVNVSSETEIYGQNAYNATTFAGNYGKLCIYNVIGKGNVTGGLYLRGGTVSLQSSIFNTCGSSAIKNEGATAEVVGCIIMDTATKYHAEAVSGTMSFIANIINSTSEFKGIDHNYIRQYTASEAALTDEYNIIPIN